MVSGAANTKRRRSKRAPKQRQRIQQHCRNICACDPGVLMGLEEGVGVTTWEKRESLEFSFFPIPRSWSVGSRKT
eukprot:7194308-Pyramimonas_sp.AAC.1